MNLRIIFSLIFLSLLGALPTVVLGQQDKPVAAEPGFVRFVTSQDQKPTESVTIYSNETAPFKVVSVTSPVSWITVTFRKATAEERLDKGSPGNDQYRLEIALDTAAATIGPIAERISIKTNSKTMPEILFPVSGMIRHAGPPTRGPSNTTEGRFSATVIDADGARLADVKVVLIRLDGKIADQEKTTGATGETHFLIIDATKPYKIHVEKPGYIPVDEDVELKVGETVKVSYTLKPTP
jgi:hypothetical protein